VSTTRQHREEAALDKSNLFHQSTVLRSFPSVKSKWPLTGFPQHPAAKPPLADSGARPARMISDSVPRQGRRSGLPIRSVRNHIDESSAISRLGLYLDCSIRLNANYPSEAAAQILRNEVRRGCSESLRALFEPELLDAGIKSTRAHSKQFCGSARPLDSSGASFQRGEQIVPYPAIHFLLRDHLRFFLPCGRRGRRR
jgi:hypothetical protein